MSTNTIKAAVIGAGAWGTALARILAQNGHTVVMWSHDESLANEINQLHENRQLFAGVMLPENLSATIDLEAACQSASLILMVVASKFYADMIQKITPLMAPEAILISATKGLDPETKKRTTQIMEDMLPPGLRERTGILSGPNIAREIAAGKPAATVCASRNQYTAEKAQAWFSQPSFRVYTNTDVVGTELGGTLKNIIAIAAGIIDGLELGDNARSALMVRAMVEIIRFGSRFGARPETFYGLAGMGDLITTCSSVMSRNHFVGENLAKGKTLKQILSEMTAVAEGVETTRLVHAIARQEGLDMPVTAQVHAILFEDKPVKQAILDLMTRELKSEH
ncbi:MAG: NAD(P)-dependent glycerol-3-phosphate dehydrogenase [Leptospiraceae bacterium]|nr:NAD(P)-dependent glycerol-3-phosphate dehydrogenase [Leptospiraceae bacterium]